MFWFWFLFFSFCISHGKNENCRQAGQSQLPRLILQVGNVLLYQYQASSYQNGNYQAHGRTEIKKFQQQNVLFNNIENSILSNHSIPGDCACTQGRKAHQGSGTVHCFPLERVSDSKQYLHLRAAKIARRYEYKVVDMK